jgi:carbamoyl-phosphate synthase large subunit
MGKEVKPFENYNSGKMFVRYSWDMIVNMKDFEQISVKGELGREKKKQ